MPPPAGTKGAVTIRPFRAGDADALCTLFRQSVAALGPLHYTTEQVCAWSSLAPSPARLLARMRDGRLCLVAASPEDRLMAFADLERDGHIGYLYAAPEAAGTGVTGLLYAKLEARARAQGLERLYTEASESARRFFRRQGFAELNRRDLTIGKVAIHNYAMEKRL